VEKSQSKKRNFQELRKIDLIELDVGDFNYCCGK
jgi:hypothetical protein